MTKPDILKIVIENCDTAICVVDPKQNDSPIIYCNPKFQELTGYTLGEIIGSNCRFLQGKDTSKETIDTIRIAVKERMPIQVTLLNYKKDKTPFWNLLNIKPIFSSDGEIDYFVASQIDLSDYKRQVLVLEEKIKYLEGLQVNHE